MARSKPHFFMFLSIQTQNTLENIPFETILKFAKHNKIAKYILTLAEIESKLDLLMGRITKNKVIEVTQESHPEAFLQIKEYLETK
jgi:hypothetical protein